MRNYDSEAYAVNRVVGTFVRRKDGTAVEVLQIAQKQVVAKELLSGKDVIFNYDELDINPVPLGYANTNGTSPYLVRSPMRNDWKQGARWKNIRWIEFTKDDDLRVREKIPSKVLGATIQGIYPTYGDTVKALTNGKERIFSKAWCRHFAMDIEWNIYHRGKYLIGRMIDPVRREYKLADDYWWTKEALEESL